MIHPIAGKCKHCKADLTSFHAARPAATAQLPALHPLALHASASPRARSGNDLTAGHTAGHAAGHAPAETAPGLASNAVPVAVPAALYEASQPMLPPRPTGRSYPAEPRASGWRSWPVVVIVVAMVAIVVAVVLMVWPASGRRDGEGKHTTAPPPAPARMQTEPQLAPPAGRTVRPAPSTPDPWAPSQPAPRITGPGGHAVDPLGSPDPAAPDDADDDVDVDLGADPFSSPHGAPSRSPGRRPLKLNGRGTVVLAMTAHLCKKLLQCGTDDPMAKRMCETLSRQPSRPPANCPAADRCFQHIDTMSCASQSDDLSQLNVLMTQFADCAEAARC